MESIMLTHPLIVILVCIIIGIVGKHLFTSKDAGTQLEKQFTESMHNIELSFTKSFGEMGEKMRKVQNEIMHDVDDKFFTKEMADKHDFRIAKVEETVAQILPRMEKIDIIYDMLKEVKEKNQ